MIAVHSFRVIDLADTGFTGQKTIIHTSYFGRGDLVDTQGSSAST